MYVNKDELRKAIIDSNTQLDQASAVGTWDTRTMPVRVERGDKPIMWINATTKDIDEEGEVIVPGGCDDQSYWFKTGSVFVDHKHDSGSMVGWKRKVIPKMESGEQYGWAVQIGMMPPGKSPYAEEMVYAAEEGIVYASIEVVGRDMGRTTVDEKKKYRQGLDVPLTIVRTWEWVGLTLTFIPMNTACRQIGYAEPFEIDDATDKRLGTIDNLICKGKIRKEIADRMGFSVFTQRKAQRELLVELQRPKMRGMLIVDGSEPSDN